MEEQVLMSNSSHDSDSDIKTQVLNDILIHRREAIRLKNLGQFALGLDELATLLSGTPFSKENYAQADDIINEIGQINGEANSNARPAHTRARRQYERDHYRQAKSLQLFNRVLRQITRLLQDEGYFDVLTQKYGPSMTELEQIKSIET